MLKPCIQIDICNYIPIFNCKDLYFKIVQMQVQWICIYSLSKVDLSINHCGLLVWSACWIKNIHITIEKGIQCSIFSTRVNSFLLNNHSIQVRVTVDQWSVPKTLFVRWELCWILCWSITGQNQYINLHLSAISYNHFTWHVFGWWDKTKGPRGNSHRQ